jgi:hypothetical protein
MKSIGIRPHPEQYAYVILEGTQANPRLIDKGIAKCPKAVSDAEMLRWVRQDVQELLTRHNVAEAGIKTVEGNARSKNTKRLHLEGVVVEGVASHACQPRTKLLVTKQIKAATGFNDLARYMATLLEKDSLQEVSSAAYEDAALAALAGLPKQ